jgi:two-component system response regulator CpxR
MTTTLVKQESSSAVAQALGSRLLIVDDDVELCDLLKEYLKHDGFTVEVIHDGRRGVERALSGEHALVILDVMLPGLNGLDVLRRIRAQSGEPVLMLTARGDEIDRIVGLEIGADDYLPKPFNPRELAARIRAVLRRTRHAADGWNGKNGSARVCFGDVELDEGARLGWCAGQPLDLTTVEFDLLETFLQSPGRVIQREELVRQVLGRSYSPFDRSIDVHVSNLRKKLGPRADGSDRIRGVRGVGYLFTSPVSQKNKKNRQ